MDLPADEFAGDSAPAASLRSEGRYRALFENMDEGFCVIEMVYDGAGKPVDYRFLEINKAFIRQTGLTDALEKSMREMIPNHDAHWFEIYGTVARTGDPIRFQNPATAMGRFYDVFAFRIGGDGSREVGILFKDVTEARRMQEALQDSRDDLERRVRERTAELAEANAGLRREAKEKAELQAQLVQAQKMDAVGRLAGGVAHDFNNLLTAIGGYSHLLLGSLPPGDKHREDVEEIKKAAERAGSLTRQLLAFSRQQVLELRVLDVNGVVSNLERMLRRIIGEDVALATVLAADAGRIKADPGQIEQVVLNLVINAKDAMPQGGKVTLETANVELGEDFARMHLQVRPGSYVMIVVSDTGTGMDAETQSHLFEPFFTTKEAGKGTGLGLATVYGIVKQSGGGIYVYSELGHGTTVKVYLPRIEGPVHPPAPVAPVRTVSGSETVLLVEDDDLVRLFLSRALRESGFKVLAASGASEAFRLCEGRRDPIHLILTDVIMPQMHGPELVKRLSTLHPEAKVVFMSGYTDTTVAHHELVNSGVPFLQKPLAPDVLARKLREVLDGPR